MPPCLCDGMACQSKAPRAETHNTVLCTSPSAHISRLSLPLLQSTYTVQPTETWRQYKTGLVVNRGESLVILRPDGDLITKLETFEAAGFRGIGAETGKAAMEKSSSSLTLSPSCSYLHLSSALFISLLRSNLKGPILSLSSLLLLSLVISPKSK